MRKLLRCLYHRTDGGAAVEFGFVFPLFAILILGLVQYGTVMLQLMNVSHAAQVGATFAMLNGYNPTNIRSSVTSATGIPAANIGVTENCGCAAGTTINFLGACSVPPPPCANGLTAGYYVTITISQDYAPVAPGFPSPLTARALVRVLQ